MNGFLKTSLVLLGLALFAACSNDSDEQTTQQPPQPKSYPLTIEVTENPLVQDGEESSSRSNRAAITTTSGLTKFYLDYKYNSTGSDGTNPAEANKNGEGKWESTAVWPTDVYEVSWYAYSIFDKSKYIQFHLNEGTPYLRFIVEESAASQHDLLVAKTSKLYDANNQTVSFAFDHACAALRFYVKKANNLGSNALTVTNIRLCNVKKDGRYYFDSGEWQSVQTDASYTLYSGDSKTINSGDYELLNNETGKPYLFLIPQTLTAWNASTNTTGAYISLTCTITKNAITVYNGEARIPFTKEFLKGKSYDVKINIGKNSLLKTDGTKIIND